MTTHQGPPRSVVVGRWVAVVALVLSALLVLAAAVVLVVWWTSGMPPLPEAPAPAPTPGAP